MYPQTVVPLTSDIHKHLRDNHAGQTGEVKLLDGVYYTANRDDGWDWNLDDVNTWEKNPVYSYKGDRYVRVTPYAYSTGTAYYYNNKADNPDKIGQVYVASGSASNYRWFKIEPIKWIILNANWLPEGTIQNYTGTYAYSDPSKAHANIELYAADVLMSGIPYSNPAASLWNSERTMYKYLNDVFYYQAFSGTDQSLIQVSTIYNNTALADRDLPAYNLNSNHLTAGGQNPTEQKIYLLSRYELGDPLSPYVVEGNQIFGPQAATGEASKRQAGGTDYARAHYLWLGASGEKSYAYYWTRSASSAAFVYYVSVDGANTSATGASNANNGARPALQLKLNRLV